VFLPQPFFGMPISGAPMGPPTYAGIVPNIHHGYPTLASEDYARIVVPTKEAQDSYPMPPLLSKTQQMSQPPPLIKAQQVSQPPPPLPTPARSKPKPLSTKKASAAGGGCKRKAPTNAPVVPTTAVIDCSRVSAGKDVISDRSADTVVPIEQTTRARPSVESTISRLLNNKQQLSPTTDIHCPVLAASVSSSSTLSPPDSASLKRKQRAPRKRGAVPLLKPSILNKKDFVDSSPPSPKCELFEPLDKMPKLELQVETTPPPPELIPRRKNQKSPAKSRKSLRIVSNWKPVGVGTKRFVYLNVSAAAFLMRSSIIMPRGLLERRW
jgi:hypothetical protein